MRTTHDSINRPYRTISDTGAVRDAVAEPNVDGEVTTLR